MHHTTRRAAPLMAMLLSTWLLWPHAAAAQADAPGSNPLIRDKFTADPAPLVVGDRLYLYVGHDEAHATRCSTCASGWSIPPPT